ncbi:SDR family NAD(P)-dependent oxidoreductase [Sphingobacteriales bacterium UPWRP_1]|nr:short-chain dehydrogenase [Sphingobacteriales bacterium TSM_CSM]PSJ72293.1 SDR family NAD(P)-dependent oxidoreductase [Sphingobacteriales bacterium UPWRP_1]
MFAVITGATKGIGRALTRRFASEGFDLAVCARNKMELQQLKTDLEQHNPTIRVVYTATDMGNKNEVLAFAEMVNKECPAIDVLINNAGLFLTNPVLREPDGLLEQMMAINLYGPYHLTRALLPKMTGQKSGHIFNICSVASLIGFEDCVSYTASKHALYGFSKALRQEMKAFNIKVTSVLPGAVYTASWESSDVNSGRIMAPEDIADAVYGCYRLSERTVVEEIVLRPMLGDL